MFIVVSKHTPTSSWKSSREFTCRLLQCGGRLHMAMSFSLRQSSLMDTSLRLVSFASSSLALLLWLVVFCLSDPHQVSFPCLGQFLMEYEFVLISIGFYRFSDSDVGFGIYSCFEISTWVKHFAWKYQSQQHFGLFSLHSPSSRLWLFQEHNQSKQLGLGNEAVAKFDLVETNAKLARPALPW